MAPARRPAEREPARFASNTQTHFAAEQRPEAVEWTTAARCRGIVTDSVTRIQVVVPVRAIGRGELLRASDVELRYVDSVSEPASVVQRLEDVVGREARQSLSGDQPLSPDAQAASAGAKTR